MIRDLIIANRTCRRFYQEVPISLKTLRELIDLARLSASGSNRQSLKYILSGDPSRNALIFPCLAWAGALKDWPGPAEGERPSAYIIILGDTEIEFSTKCSTVYLETAKVIGGEQPVAAKSHHNWSCDHGIAAQSIFLGARERGFGGCMHGAVKRKALSKVLGIPPRYEILLVLSLGKPREKVVLDTIGPDGNFDYWRDSDNIHHVPKRLLGDIIISEL